MHELGLYLEMVCIQIAFTRNRSRENAFQFNLTPRSAFSCECIIRYINNYFITSIRHKMFYYLPIS